MNAEPHRNPFENDRELVAQLLAMNPAAWDYLCIEVIAPMTRTAKYVQIFNRYAIPLDSIIGQVYLDLTGDDCRRLRKFRFEGRLEAWLYFQLKDSVKRILREASGKIPFTRSENDFQSSPVILSMDSGDDRPEREMSREEANYCIAQLWKENPMKAYVLLLRFRQDLSAGEVGLLLGKGSNNIDQIGSRAKAGMREIRETLP